MKQLLRAQLDHFFEFWLSNPVLSFPPTPLVSIFLPTEARNAQVKVLRLPTSEFIQLLRPYHVPDICPGTGVLSLTLQSSRSHGGTWA